jgi:hypothetical protein
MLEQDPDALDSYESRLSPLEKRVRTILGFIVVWLMVAAILLLYAIPRVPSGVSEWVTFIILAPPAYLLAEGVGRSLTAPWRGITRAERIFRVVVLAAAVVVCLGLFLLRAP